MKLIVIPDSKRESARRYINNNLGPTELLALCDDMFDVVCLKKDKNDGVYNRTLNLLRLQDVSEALQFEVVEAAYQTFGKVACMLFNNDVNRCLYGPYIAKHDL